MFNELDRLLSTRKVPEVPEGLSARIVAAAHRADDLQPAKDRKLDIFNGWLEGIAAQVQSLVSVPQPAYVVAGAVVFAIGAYMGVYADGSSILSGLSVGDLASFMVINDSFVVAEWV